MDFLLDKKIKSWIFQCSRIIKENRNFSVESKSSDKDLVTDIDRMVEDYLVKEINKEFPGHDILGEETSFGSKDFDTEKENLWIIDPIDGTSNFVKENRDYCTMIAYFEKGQGKFSYIYDYTHHELLSAFSGLGVFLNDLRLEKPEDKSLSKSILSLSSDMFRNSPKINDLAEEAISIRAVGASGLDGTRVAKGEFGAYINTSASPWDFAPFIVIAEELDLHISDPWGDKLDLGKKSGYIISSHKAYEDIKRILSN